MLQLENLGVRYGNQIALDGMWYNFLPGHIYGLVGPNGCGKSTLMKTAAGLLKNYTGTVLYEGKRIGTATRARVAYLPTHPVYYRYMSVEDMGAFYEDFFKDFDRNEYRRMISFFGLDPEQKMVNMSTGMVAKVRVAATLSRRAGVILLDEPLNGIDLIGQDQVRQIILSLELEGRIIIIASHMFDQLEAVCDHVVMMNAGKVLIHGDLQSLREQYGMSVSDLYRSTYAQLMQMQAGGGMRTW
ncbi:MAG: ATP-binding cassette domain-containing protein [Ruminococcus sp.]|nr:ATP-binding cassette domain-containing protein [Ruminococcus sp.]